jgi:hypothetical protein
MAGLEPAIQGHLKCAAACFLDGRVKPAHGQLLERKRRAVQPLGRAARQSNLAQGGKSEALAAFGGREGGAVLTWCVLAPFQEAVLVEIDHSKSKTDHCCAMHYSNDCHAGFRRKETDLE